MSENSTLSPAVRAAWEQALAWWGVQVHEPVLVPGEGGAVGSFAWFSVDGTQVSVDTAMLVAAHMEKHLPAVFAHEVGHHVVSPATRLTSLKILHQMTRALALAGVDFPARHAPLLSNLWNDLLVNARLDQVQRAATGESGMTPIGAALAEHPATVRGSRIMWVYLRTYEHLWALPAGTLASAAPPAPPATSSRPERDTSPTQVPERYRDAEAAYQAARAEAQRLHQQLAEASMPRPTYDAARLAHVVRAFAWDPVSGAMAAGMILAPYMREDATPQDGDASGMGCAETAEAPTVQELGAVLADRRLWEEPPDVQEADARAHGIDPGQAEKTHPGGGQALGMAHTLALYSTLPPDAVMSAWYRTQARTSVRPWRTVRGTAPGADLVGPLELWDAGDDLADIDWPGTFHASPVVVPGVTTRRRSTLEDEPVVHEGAITLDLYVDSSGSMRHPQSGSPAVLAGAILCQSILAGGGKVRVTSFSGPGQVAGTADFSRKEAEVWQGLLHFFGGGTSFPLDLYERRYAGMREPREGEARHVVVLSDDGLSSMFGAGNARYESVAARVRTVLTTGTLMVCLPYATTTRPTERDGYRYLYLDSMDDAPAACARLAEVLRG